MFIEGESMQRRVTKTVKIPENVEVSIENTTVIVRGPKGELKRHFKLFQGMSITKREKEIIVEAYNARRREKALVGTIASHIKNMIVGVTKGYTYRLKKVFVHFPFNVKVEGNKIIIENLGGEKAPRITRVVGNVDVKVEGDDIIVSGINIEEVGQTAANIQQISRIKNKDPRKFIDGIYLISKE